MQDMSVEWLPRLPIEAPNASRSGPIYGRPNICKVQRFQNFKVRGLCEQAPGAEGVKAAILKLFKAFLEKRGERDLLPEQHLPPKAEGVPAEPGCLNVAVSFSPGHIFSRAPNIGPTPRGVRKDRCPES